MNSSYVEGLYTANQMFIQKPAFCSVGKRKPRGQFLLQENMSDVTDGA